jgi:hypothetical protein
MLKKVEAKCKRVGKSFAGREQHRLLLGSVQKSGVGATIASMNIRHP